MGAISDKTRLKGKNSLTSSKSLSLSSSIGLFIKKQPSINSMACKSTATIFPPLPTNSIATCDHPPGKEPRSKIDCPLDILISFVKISLSLYEALDL